MSEADGGIKVVEATLADLTQDAKNANRGTDRGREILSASIERHGAGRSVLIDR